MNRRLHYLLPLFLLLILPGCEESDTVTPVEIDFITQPSNPTPENESIVYDSEADLAWTPALVTDGNVTYDVYFGTGNPPPLYQSGLEYGPVSIDSLEEYETYYWKVIAVDERGEGNESDVWSFTCLENSDHLLLRTTNWGVIGAVPVYSMSMRYPDQNSQDLLYSGRFLAATNASDNSNIIGLLDYTYWQPVSQNGEILELEYDELGDDHFTHIARYIPVGDLAWSATVDECVTAFPLGEGPSKSMLVEIELTWEGGEGDSLYLGWDVDFDLPCKYIGYFGFSGGQDDRIGYDIDRSLIYMWDGDNHETNLIDTLAPPTFVGLAHIASSSGLASLQWQSLGDHMGSGAEQYKLLSRGSKSGIRPWCRDLYDVDYDYRAMISSGPIDPVLEETYSLVVAICAGDDLEDLQNVVDEVNDWYNENR